MARVRALRVVLAAASLLALAPGCSEGPKPLEIAEDRIIVRNLTGEDWTGVEVRVNQYYLATAPRLAAGGQLDAPLRRFQGGFGYYFDPRREALRLVEVSARTAGGAPVRLGWRRGG